MGVLYWIFIGLMCVGGIWIAYQNGIFDSEMFESGTSYDGMSATELKEIAIDLDDAYFQDLNNRVRGSDGLIIYDQKDEGKVIFIEGFVMHQSNKIDNGITVCEDSAGGFDCNMLYIETSGDFSYEWADDIRGWVEIRETFDEIKNNVYYDGISAREILLECIDCN